MKRTLIVAMLGLVAVVAVNVFYMNPQILPPSLEDQATSTVDVNQEHASSTSGVVLGDGKTETDVVQAFEGEADPARMSLSMKQWNWLATTDSGGVHTTPNVADKFTLLFTPPNTFSAGTDCNGVGGQYTVVGSKIVLDKMMSTRMFCEGSQEGDFGAALSAVDNYHFTTKGELVFDLKSGGTMLFR